MSCLRYLDPVPPDLGWLRTWWGGVGGGTPVALLQAMARHVTPMLLSLGFAIACAGCTGFITGESFGSGSGSGSDDPVQEAADQWNNNAYPLFNSLCVGCHNNAAMMATTPQFLAGTDAASMRTTLLGFPGGFVNLTSPADSLVVTEGPAHPGTTWPTGDPAIIQTWVEAEQAAAATTMPGDGTLETDPMPLQLCVVPSGGDDSACPKTTFDLSGLGLPGASITLVAQQLTPTSGIYIDFLSLNGAAAGAYIEHPLFIDSPTGEQALEDEFDQFETVKTDVAPSTAAAIGAGAAAFTEFVPTDPIVISFKVVMPYQPAVDMPPTGGCNDVADFITDAQPLMNSDCASCHAGSNASATNAMNLTGINTPNNATAIAAACAQALNHASITAGSIPTSLILVEPDPAQAAGHPFKITNAGNLTTFKTDLTNWLTKEAAAAP